MQLSNLRNLRQLLGKNFGKYSFDRDLRDDEIHALDQFPSVTHPYMTFVANNVVANNVVANNVVANNVVDNNFKRKRLLEEMIETDMFPEMIFPEENLIEIDSTWEDDIDLLALHKMKITKCCANVKKLCLKKEYK
jgi:hypothetical protein